MTRAQRASWTRQQIDQVRTDPEFGDSAGGVKPVREDRFRVGEVLGDPAGDPRLVAQPRLTGSALVAMSQGAGASLGWNRLGVPRGIPLPAQRTVGRRDACVGQRPVDPIRDLRQG